MVFSLQLLVVLPVLRPRGESLYFLPFILVGIEHV